MGNNKKNKKYVPAKPKVETIFVDAKIATPEYIAKVNEKTSQNINLIYALAMVQESLIIDTEAMQKKIGGYKYNIKNRINTIKDTAINLRKEVNAKCGYEFADMIGDKSDEIWNLLVNHFGERKI